MRCVTRNEANTELGWVVSVSAVTYWRVFSGYVLLPMEMSNNLRVVIWSILLSVRSILWVAKWRLCEKVGNLTFALSTNLLWISTFACCANFGLFGGLVSVSAVTYWRVFSGYVLLPMEMSNNLRVVIWSIILSVRQIWWAAKCGLWEKVGNLAFALFTNWLWISIFVGCTNFRLFGGLVSVSAVTYWRVFSAYVLLPMEMSNNLCTMIWSILLSVR